MTRYFFNVHDGKTIIDNEGIELPGLDAARQMAIVTSGEMLKNGAGPAMWAGEPWRMSGGETLFTLKFSAAEGAGTSP